MNVTDSKDEAAANMKLSEDEIALLGDIDDDWYGLWEVDWFFNGAHREWSHETRVTFLSGLVQQGLVEIFFGPVMTERPPLALDIALQALANPASWSPATDVKKPGYYATTSAICVTALHPPAS